MLKKQRHMAQEIPRILSSVPEMGRKPSFLFSFFFLVVLGFELRASCLLDRLDLNHCARPFLGWVLQDSVLRTIFPGWF
jgi:hypothetical protein